MRKAWEPGKITVAVCLQAITIDLQLITQNGLATNKLMGFAELDKLAEADMTKENLREGQVFD